MFIFVYHPKQTLPWQTISSSKKPTNDLLKAFGLFALLLEKGFSKGPLNPAEGFIIVSKTQKTFYSSPNELQNISAIDIPSNYDVLLSKFVNS